MSTVIAGTSYAHLARVSGARYRTEAAPAVAIASPSLRVERGRTPAIPSTALLFPADAASPQRQWLQESNRLDRLGRVDLVAIAYRNDGTASRHEVLAAAAQLAANDEAYLQTAKALAASSGDDRVHWAAQVALEQARAPGERTMSDAEVAVLKLGIAATNAAYGEPQSLSLRYPNGWSSSPAAASQPPSSSGPVGIASVVRAYAASALDD